MQIIKINNTNFGNKTKTSQLFEAMIGQNFESRNIEAFKRVYEDLAPEKKFVGHYGYKGFFEKKLLNKILDNYPTLKSDRNDILEKIKDKNISRQELSQIISPYLEKYGEIIDINI